MILSLILIILCVCIKSVGRIKCTQIQQKYQSYLLEGFIIKDLEYCLQTVKRDRIAFRQPQKMLHMDSHIFNNVIRQDPDCFRKRGPARLIDESLRRHYLRWG